MTVRIYTVWAALKEDLSAQWMIWACDEYSYEGDPDARETELAAAKSRQGGEVEYREVTFLIDSLAVDKAFDPTEIEARTE